MATGGTFQESQFSFGCSYGDIKTWQIESRECSKDTQPDFSPVSTASCELSDRFHCTSPSQSPKSAFRRPCSRGLKVCFSITECDVIEHQVEDVESSRAFDIDSRKMFCASGEEDDEALEKQHDEARENALKNQRVFVKLEETDELDQKALFGSSSSLSTACPDVIEEELRLSSIESLRVEDFEDEATFVDEDVVCQAAQALESAEFDTRENAVKTFANMAVRGNALAVAEVSARLHHEECYVRESAAQALAHVGKLDDESVIASLTTCLQDEDHDVRMAAVQAFAKYKGVAQAIAAVTQLGETSADHNVKRAVTWALAKLK